VGPWADRQQEKNPMTGPKNTICLWLDKDAEEAAAIYVKTFADSALGALQRAHGFSLGQGGRCAGAGARTNEASHGRSPPAC
ncbi:MAG: VOC family protein, partial [Rhodobacteraceae bacterium]|nr:VOC family protein [Paracoccaceae bacterium]